MAFIEQCLAGDPTNWWGPNHAYVEALLRTSGFQIMSRPAHEIHLCTPSDQDPHGMARLIACKLRAAVGQRHASDHEL